MQRTMILTNSGVIWITLRRQGYSEIHPEQAADGDESAQVQNRSYFENFDAGRIEKQLVGIVTIDEAEHPEHDYRQRRNNNAAQASLRRQCVDLQPQPLAGANDFGQSAHDQRQAAADFGLHFDRDYEQPKVLFGYALEHVLERTRQRQSDSGLFEHGAELTAQRVGKLLHHNLQSAIERMAGLERRLHQIQCKRQLGDEGPDPPRAAEADVQDREQAEPGAGC